MLQELTKRVSEIEKRLQDIGAAISAESESLKKKQQEQEKLNHELRILLQAKKELEGLK